MIDEAPPLDAYSDEEIDSADETELGEYYMDAFVDSLAESVPQTAADSGADLEAGLAEDDEGGASQRPPSEQGPLIPVPSLQGEAIQSESWVALLPRLELSGLTLNLAMQAVLHEIAGDRLVFVMDGRHYDLLNQSHRQRITQALERVLGRALQIEFQIGEAQWESPAQHRRRQQAERQAQAVAAIKSDPRVAELMQTFGAVVVEDSIQPV